MGFLATASTDSPTVSSETMGTATYPLIVAGSTATNVWTPTNTLPPNNRGALILSKTQTVSAPDRKLTMHGGLPYVWNSRTGVGTPVGEALTLALFLNGTCIRAISLSLTPGVAFAAFAQIAATVTAAAGSHSIEMRLMVPATGSQFTVSGMYAAAGNPFMVVRESS